MKNYYLVADAITAIDSDIIEEYLAIKNDLRFKSKSTRFKTHWKKWTTLAACAILVMSFVMIHFARHNSKPFDLPVDADEILWSTDIASDNQSNIVLQWQGLKVSEGLFAALLSAQEKDYLAIYVRADENKLNNFIYDGKKYQDYYLELDQLRTLLIKLESLKKDGETLKYGEKVYTEGVPSGDKWSKELYEQTISYYGAELLNLYIVDGEFLRSKVEDDMIETENKIQSLYPMLETIRNEFNLQDARMLCEQFQKSGYDVTVAGTTMYLFITKEDLVNLNISNVNQYVFHHASYRDYANAEMLPG